AISNLLHVRMTVEQYFRSDRRHPRLTLELPGRDPITGVHMVFVSNVDPWTYFGKRPVRTNPGTGTAGRSFARTTNRGRRCTVANRLTCRRIVITSAKRLRWTLPLSRMPSD